MATDPLMGPQGPQGPQGFQGVESTAPGLDGPQGAQGPRGLMGYQGPRGSASTAQGPQGPQGFQGAMGRNGPSLAGPQGPQGDDGPQGSASTVQGPQGYQGGSGVQGPQGVRGNDSTVQGPQGYQGTASTVQGTQGPQGYQGSASTVQGPQGYQGNQGYQGSASTVQGPQGSASTVQGPQGYQGSASTVQGPQGSASTVQGPQGYQGYQGYQGSASTVQGPQGAASTVQGPQGYQGNQGYQGSASTVQGPQGAASTVQGPQGSRGNDSTVQGPQGAASTVQGPQGPQGTASTVQGPQGYQGPQGTASTVQGPQGYQGSASTVQGPQGPQGYQGQASTVQGPIGPQGSASTVHGPQGYQGNQGYQGIASTVQGPQGYQGSQGYQGNQGYQGYQGQTGSSTITMSGVTYYLDNNNPAPYGTYYPLVRNLPTGNVLDNICTVSSSNSPQQFDVFVTPPSYPGVSMIPSGNWDFNFYSYASAIDSGNSYIRADVYKLSVGTGGSGDYTSPAYYKTTTGSPCIGAGAAYPSTSWNIYYTPNTTQNPYSSTIGSIGEWAAYDTYSVQTSIPTALRTFYVSTSGNDANSVAQAQSSSTPWRTIGHAVATATTAGDLILVRGGTYTEYGITFGSTGTSAHPIVLKAYTGETPIINPHNDGTFLPTNSANIINVTGTYIVIDGITFTHGDIPLRLSGNRCVVRNCIFDTNYGTGLLVVGSYCTVEYNISRFNCYNNQNLSGANGWGGGIQVGYYNSVGSVVRYNHAYNNYGEGMDIMVNYGCLVENNTVHDNWAENLYITNAAGALVRNNLCYQTPGNPFHARSACRLMVFADEFASPLTEDHIVINNMFYGGDVGLFEWTRQTGSGMHSCLIANNTIVNGRFTSGASIAVNSNTTVRNNITFRNDGGSTGSISVGSRTGMAFDHNGWWSNVPANVAGTGDVTADPKLALAGSVSTQTLLFTAQSPVITSTTGISLSWTSAQNDFLIDITDRILIKIMGVTTRTASTVLHFSVLGTVNYPTIVIPLSGSALTSFQNPNQIFSGPPVAPASSPAFRYLVGADMPDISNYYLNVFGSQQPGFVFAGPLSGNPSAPDFRQLTSSEVITLMASSSATFYRPANTTTYTAMDAVSDSTSAPTVLTFANMALANGGQGTIRQATLLINDVACTAQFRLYLFTVAPTAINDNSPFTLMYADAASLVGFIDFPSCVTEGSGSDAAFANWNDMLAFVTATATSSLYGLLATETAYATPGSGKGVTIKLTVAY